MSKGLEPTNLSHRLLGIDQQRTTDRYFFDVDDGEDSYHDDIGIDLVSVKHIAPEAYNILKQIVYDRWPEGQRTMTIRVRDGSGKLVYAGTMTINGRRSPPGGA